MHVRSGRENRSFCLDEKSKQLLKDSRTPLPIRPGMPVRQDYEYVRAGTCNLFVAVEPKGGQRRGRKNFCVIGHWREIAAHQGAMMTVTRKAASKEFLTAYRQPEDSIGGRSLPKKLRKLPATNALHSASICLRSWMMKNGVDIGVPACYAEPIARLMAWLCAPATQEVSLPQSQH